MLPPSLNDTIITLIPKLASLVLVKVYLPIALCNMLYKLISKILVNRLKRILFRIISCNQFAFVPSRMTTDNILVAFELIYAMNWKTRGRVEWL